MPNCMDRGGEREEWRRQDQHTSHVQTSTCKWCRGGGDRWSGRHPEGMEGTCRLQAIETFSKKGVLLYIWIVEVLIYKKNPPHLQRRLILNLLFAW